MRRILSTRSIVVDRKVAAENVFAAARTTTGAEQCALLPGPSVEVGLVRRSGRRRGGRFLRFCERHLEPPRLILPRLAAPARSCSAPPWGQSAPRLTPARSVSAPPCGQSDRRRGRAR